jgi:hypothetical protein
LVRLGEGAPRYAKVEEIAARLEPDPDAMMPLVREFSAFSGAGVVLVGTRIFPVSWKG